MIIKKFSEIHTGKVIVRKAAVLMVLLAMVIQSGWAVGATAQAASRDVTSRYSKDAGVKKLTAGFDTIAGYQISSVLKKGKTAIYKFSKVRDRQRALRYNQKISDGAAYDTISHNLFGRSTAKGKVTLGDWGETAPDIRITKVTKNTKKLTVYGNLRFVSARTGEVETAGTVRLTIEKKAGSRYGYIAKKLTCKKN